MKKKYSIKKSDDIQKILNKGRFYKSKYYIVYVTKNNTNKNYVAFLAGKKLGNAPIRNKIKRKVRVAMQNNWQNLEKGYNIVIIARPFVLQESIEILTKDLAFLCKRHKILSIIEQYEKGKE